MKKLSVKLFQRRILYISVHKCANMCVVFYCVCMHTRTLSHTCTHADVHTQTLWNSQLSFHIWSHFFNGLCCCLSQHLLLASPWNLKAFCANNVQVLASQCLWQPRRKTCTMLATNSWQTLHWHTSEHATQTQCKSPFTTYTQEKNYRIFQMDNTHRVICASVQRVTYAVVKLHTHSVHNGGYHEILYCCFLYLPTHAYTHILKHAYKTLCSSLQYSHPTSVIKFCSEIWHCVHTLNSSLGVRMATLLLWVMWWTKRLHRYWRLKSVMESSLQVRIVWVNYFIYFGAICVCVCVCVWWTP